MKILSAVSAAVLATSALASGQEVLRGKWFEDDYLFAMSTEWEDVQGSWGKSQYKLSWDSYDKKLEGNTAGVYQELEFEELLSEIRGESYCGWIDLKYIQASDLQLTGNFCSQSISQRFADKAAMMAWVKSTIFPEFVREFPEPTREPIRAFLGRIINPY